MITTNSLKIRMYWYMSAKSSTNKNYKVIWWRRLSRWSSGNRYKITKWTMSISSLKYMASWTNGKKNRIDNSWIRISRSTRCWQARISKHLIINNKNIISGIKASMDNLLISNNRWMMKSNKRRQRLIEMRR